MIKGLKRFAAGGLLIKELRGIRLELARQADLTVRLARALEEANAHRWPRQVPSAVPAEGAVEISFVDDEEQRTFMDIELRLTSATGQRPTEDDILAEWERMRAAQP